MSKTIVSITGIRPDFIRMSKVFQALDNCKKINHIMILTGQHYDKMLCETFFTDLNIRKPNYVLDAGKLSTNHYEQLSYLSRAIPELFKTENINPDLILFLGDSNNVCISLVLKKEGYKIVHIEAGMRSYDDKMFEEINRICCDHCSNLLFVYHNNYAKKLYKENIKNSKNIKVHVVGNTIVEVLNNMVLQMKLFDICREKTHILVDIHRPENFKNKYRLEKIIYMIGKYSDYYSITVKMLKFPSTLKKLTEFSIIIPECIELIELCNYTEYIKLCYNSLFTISDSGTAQEECCLIKVPVIVPRDFTERPESNKNGCSFMIDVQLILFNKSIKWINKKNKTQKFSTSWLLPPNSKDKTSELIVKLIQNDLSI